MELIPNCPYGFCGRKATFQEEEEEEEQDEEEEEEKKKNKKKEEEEEKQEQEEEGEEKKKPTGFITSHKASSFKWIGCRFPFPPPHITPSTSLQLSSHAVFLNFSNIMQHYLKHLCMHESQLYECACSFWGWAWGVDTLASYRSAFLFLQQ